MKSGETSASACWRCAQCSRGERRWYRIGRTAASVAVEVPSESGVRGGVSSIDIFAESVVGTARGNKSTFGTSSDKIAQLSISRWQ